MKARVRGFTLIEALIALAVLSLGLLGAAAMLLESLHAQGQSLRRTAATLLLRDMAERIRANPTALAHYAAVSAASIPPSCSAAGCDPAQLAAADVAHFAAAARRVLPAENHAAIEYVPAAGPAAPGRLVISLRWQDPRADGPETVALQVSPQPAAG